MDSLLISGREALPPHYAPAVVPWVSIEGERVLVHLIPLTSISEYEWLFLLEGFSLPSLTQLVIQRVKDAVGDLSRVNSVAIADLGLPPPFSGISLSEMSNLALPLRYYYAGGNGPYGVIGGQLPETSEQMVVAFASIIPYIETLKT